MDVDVIVKFLNKSTIWILAFIYNVDGALVNPTGSISVILNDPNGVQKAGYISVAASLGFTAGDVVTGGTSEATGVVISMPDATTLELQRVTGVWQSGESLTAADEETTTTSSLLLGATMTQYDSTTGIYEYKYRTDEDSPEGDWPGEVWVVDGAGTTAIHSPGTFSVEVKKGL